MPVPRILAGVTLVAMLVLVASVADSEAAPAPTGASGGDAGPLPAPDQRAVDQAVERGLFWLRDQQTAQGGWTGSSGHKRSDGYLVFYDEEWQRDHGQAHAGVSALAGLAFLASGYLPDRGSFSPVLDRCVDYIIERTGPTGYITDGGSRMYGHAFALLFLTQVHGMTRRRELDVDRCLREAARFVVENQNQYGAWRYTPGMQEADLSVTVSQVQALRAARNVGVQVPRATIDRVSDYVKQSLIQRGPDAGAFYYKIYGRAAMTKTSFAINAAAVTCLHSAGIYDPRLHERAFVYLENGYRELTSYYPHHFYYWYGNYYAVQAFHMEGGQRWERHWARVAGDLLRRQRPDGSWHNDVGPGDAFATAMACLILRVPLGYLPVFRH